MFVKGYWTHLIMSSNFKKYKFGFIDKKDKRFVVSFMAAREQSAARDAYRANQPLISKVVTDPLEVFKDVPRFTSGNAGVWPCALTNKEVEAFLGE